VLLTIRGVIEYRELLLSLVIRDVKARYKQSFLGVIWAILNPLAMMLVLSFVFTRFIEVPTEGLPYPVFLYCGLLPWNFFATSLSSSAMSLVNNAHLVTKVSFPREVFPISAILVNLVDFFLASSVLFGLLLFYGVRLTFTLLLAPLMLLIQLFLTAGVGMVSSAMNLFYRDVKHIVNLGMMLWMYLTPVVYPTSLVPERYVPIYMLNPMAVIIDGYRKVILEGCLPNSVHLATATLISLIVLLVGHILFKKWEPLFAEMI
jgi:lipopolysaccharide transport system permease protein